MQTDRHDRKYIGLYAVSQVVKMFLLRFFPTVYCSLLINSRVLIGAWQPIAYTGEAEDHSLWPHGAKIVATKSYQ